MKFAEFLEWMKNRKWRLTERGAIRARTNCPLQVWTGSRKHYTSTARKRGMRGVTINAIICAADGYTARTYRQMKKAARIAT